MPGTLTARFESMKRGNTRWSTFSYSWKRKGANLRHTNSTRICWTKCQILEEKTVMRAKDDPESRETKHSGRLSIMMHLFWRNSCIAVHARAN